MLQWFRDRSRLLAATVLWSLVTVSAVSAFTHETECDDASERITRWHDPSGHHVGAPKDGDRPLHCFLCHWVRSFGADAVREWRAPVAVPCRAPALVMERGALLAAARFALSPRAPPSTFPLTFPTT